MKTLSSIQLKKLDSHQHQSSGVSLLEPFVQLFWNWLTKFLPRWIAPNVLSVCGLSVNVTTSLLLIYYCPTATEIAPLWLYAVNAAGLITFQAFDAFSREHARFTGTSSPLNELFNHGCYSVSLVFLVLGACISLKLGNYSSIMTLVCLTSYATFYSFHWCAYVTGVSYVGKFHAIEVQFFAVFLFGVNFLLGPNAWQQPVPTLGYSVYLIPVGVIIVGSACTIIYWVKIILDGGCGDNGATIADTSVISPSFSPALIMILSLMVARKSESFLCEHHPVLYLLFVGISCAKFSNCLVVSHLTKNELKHFDTSMLGLFALFLNQYFDCILNEHLLLWLCTLFTIIDLLHYLVPIYLQIAAYSKVKIFSLVSLEPHIKVD